MNVVYLVVWSRARKTWIVASELAKRCSRKATSTTVRRCDDRARMSRTDLGSPLSADEAQHEPGAGRLEDPLQPGLLRTSLLIAVALLLAELSTSAQAQTVLAPGQDVSANGLNLGLYNLQLGGDVTWLANFDVNSAARSNISIDGAGHVITAGPSSGQRLLSLFQNNSNISITNATLTSQPFTGPRFGMFLLSGSNVTANLNLEGTTVQNIGPTDFNTYASADYGPFISVRGGSNSVLNINGGTTGVTFQGNHGLADQPGTIGLFGSNTINFTGKVTFANNWTANYGGAVTVYEAVGEVMTFAGETAYANNHASVFGGAIDFWGGSSTMTYNAPVTFSGNYVYGNTAFTADYPNHVNDQHSRGGAINIGYIASTGSNSVNLNTNSTALFDGNFVIESKTNFNALGGAVSAFGNGGNYNYFMNFNGATTFSNNYVYSVTGSGLGGAIYYDSGPAAVLNLGPGSNVINNYAKTLGGGIYLQTGTINLKANGGDITFQGNRQAASFTSIGGGLFAPVVGSGTPNAIYLNGTGSLNLDAGTGNFIHFYDPIASTAGATITVNKTGTGTVAFHGNSSSPGDPAYNSSILTNTNVNGGTFSLTDGVTYGNSGFGVFTVNNGGTVQGENGSNLFSQTIAINSGGTVAANGGVFNLSAGTGITSTAGRFAGLGSIVAPSISLSGLATNISTAEVAGGNTLTLDTALTGAGGLRKASDGALILSRQSTYTGGTVVNAGTLQLGTDGADYGSVVAGIIRGAVTVNPGATLVAAGRNSMGSSGTAANNLNAVTLIGSTLTHTGSTDNGWGVAYDLTGATMQTTGGGQFSFGANPGFSTSVTAHASDTTSVIAGHVRLRENNVGNAVNFNVESGTTASGIDLLVSALVGEAGGAHGLVKLGAGNMTMTADNTYTGGTTISAGTLQLGDGGTTGSITGNVTDNGALVLNRSNAFTFGGLISGTGTLTQAGSGTSTLTGINTYSGGTFLNAGILSIGADANLGAAAGALTFNGGTLQLTNALTTTRSVTLNTSGIIDTQANAGTLSGVIAGAGALIKQGAGTLTLTGNNTYAGGTTIGAGTLQVGDGGTTGSIVGNVTDNGTLIFNRSDSTSYGGVVSGSGALTKLGAGTLALSGNHTYTGTTTISTGTLQLGDGGASGSIVGPIVDNAALAINRSDSVTLPGAISGTGTFAQSGPGTTILTSANTYSGATSVNAGTLWVNGSIASPMTTVFSGATLGGIGSIGGAVTVLDGGHLAPGNSPGTLTIGGDLLLSSASQLDYELGQANVPGGALNDLATVGGNLTLDGMLNVTVSAGGAFGPGVYRVFNYAGALTNSGLDFGAVPAGFTPNVDLLVQTAVPQQVNLINAQALGPLTFWDGSDTAQFNNSIVNGGSGTWLASGDAAWTDSTGAVNSSWQVDGFAVFQGAPGTVTVDNSAGAATFSGAQFAVSGYAIAGQPLTTSTADTIVRVGDGTAAGTAMTSTIGAVIQGSGGIDKTDLGTLVLSGANAYTGGTTVAGGVLSISSDGNLGDASGALTFNGGTLLTTASLTSARAVNLVGSGTIDNGGNTDTFSGVFSGAGALTSSGSGMLVLTADNTYSGGTTISAGTLQVGNGGATGSVVGNIVDNGTLAFNRSAALTYGGAISGSGAMRKMGAGTLVLTGENTHTGGTTIASGGGVVQIGNGGTTGSLVGNVAFEGGGITNIATLAFNRSDDAAFSGSVSGFGRINKLGTNTLTLSGDVSTSFGAADAISVQGGALTVTGTLGASSPGGGTTVASGATLDIGNGGTSGMVTGNLTDNGAVVVNRSDNVSLNTQIGGTGSFTKLGTNTVVLTAPNTYTGLTTIASGTLQLGVASSNGLIAGDVLIQDSGIFAYSRNASTTYAGTISGTGSVLKQGFGTWTLTGTNTYTGGTTITNGTLSIANDDNMGDPAGSLTFTGGTLLTTAGITSARAVNMTGNGTINNGGNADTFTGLLSGAGAHTFAGAGTTTLTADNTYTGGTTISTGTLQLGNGGTTGSVVGNILDNGALVYNRSNAHIYDGVISGSGSLAVASGKLTLSANQTYTGGTTIDTGTTLQLGDGSASGSLVGNIVDNGEVVFHRSDVFTYGGVVSGSGNLVQTGTGTTILAGANTYTGTTTVNAGTLWVNGSIASPMTTVLNGATLGGIGTVGGSVTVMDGGRFAPGNSPGTLTVSADLLFSPASQLDYELGQANVPGGPLNDLTTVGGNLTLDGMLNVAVSSGGAFGPGVYRLIDYAGGLTNSGLDFGTVPMGFTPNVDLLVQTSVAQQVNLINAQALGPLTFWDGSSSALFNNGAVNGGSGTWLASAPDGAWTDSTGAVNAPWQADGFAIFQAMPGTVTVDNSVAAVTFSGAQFAVSGYTITGQPLTTNTADTIVRVGDGTAAGAAMTATMSSVIQGSGGLRKTDLGTLILSSANTYTGGATIEGGTLSISSDANLGDAASELIFTGGTLLTTGPVLSPRAVNLTGNGTIDNGGNLDSFTGVLGGVGTLTSTGAGTLILSGANTYTGGTVLNAGTLSIASDAHLGAASGALTFNAGTLLTTAGVASTRAVNLAESGTIDNGGNTDTFSGVFSGAGALISIGSGTTILAGNNTYSGGTTISAGTLQIGDGGASGSLVGNVLDNSVLAFDRSDASSFAGIVSGSGSLVQQGNGTLTLTGASTYAGTTSVNAGTLLIDGNQTAATGAVNVASGATLGGIGTTGGDVTVADGGHLVGSQGLMFSMNALTLNPTSQVDITVTAPGTIGLFNINGNGGGAGDLLLDGNLNITAVGALGPGVYRVMHYAGALTNNGLDFGTVPVGFTPNVDLLIQLSVAQQVNLVNAQSVGPLTFWDGNDPALFNNGQVNGGSGTWRAQLVGAPVIDTWSDVNGVVNAQWLANGFAIFQATPGTVTVDNGAGAVTFSGAQFAVDGYTITGQPLTTSTADTIVRVGDGTVLGAAMTATVDAVIQGSGGLHKTDLGTLVLTGTNTYSGGTTVGGGTLSIASDAHLGAANAPLTLDGGRLLTTGGVDTPRAVTVGALGGTVDNGGNTDTLFGVISGPGALTFAGSGTVQLEADNTYAGGTTIAGGTLVLGRGGATGSVVGDIVDHGALVLNRSGATSYDGVISGTGSLTTQTGTVTLTGANTYAGATTVNAGTLFISGNQSAATGAVSVAANAALGGIGTTGGSVAVADDARLIGVQGQTFTMSALTLSPLSHVDVSLAAPSTTALFGINGNLVLDGVIDITSTGAFGPGLYRLMNYSGALTNNGIDFGAVPEGFTPNLDLFVQTSAAQQVNLVNTQGALLTFWDGSNSALFNNGRIDGGAGTWLATTGQAWADSTGTLNGPWQTDGFAIFQGTPGTVTVDNSAGAVMFSGAQFAVGGYTITGQPLTTRVPLTALRVGDGTDAGAAMTATISATLQGSGGIDKADLGTLVLTGANTYSGGTRISSGTLRVGNDSALGDSSGALAFSGGTLQLAAAFDPASTRAVALNAAGGTIDTQGFDSTLTQAISGSGGLIKSGTGALRLMGNSTYSGSTRIEAGRLQVDGAIVSPVMASANGLLAGNGRVGALINAGHVAPGASLGTLSVAGDFTQLASGVLDVELNDQGRFDVLNVAGAASLAGRVDYAPDPGSTFPNDLLYTYLPASGGVSGTFTNSLQEYAGVRFQTLYSPDNVQVRISSQTIEPPDNDNLAACINSLDRQRGAALDAQGSRMLGALVLTPTPEQLVDAAIDLCPRDPSALVTAVQASTNTRLSQVANRIAQVHAGVDEPDTAGLFDAYRLREGVEMWLRGYYQGSEGDRVDLFRRGYESDGRSFVLGVDVALANSGVVGAYLALDDLDLAYHGPTIDTGRARLDGWAAGVYGSYWGERRWFVQGALEYGGYGIDATRDVTFGPIAEQAQGDRDARAWTATAGGGYNFIPSDGWLIQPQVHLRYERFDEDAYNEHGVAALDLSYGDLDAETFRGEAGLTVRRSLPASTAKPEISVLFAYANYVYDDALDDRERTARFAIAEPFSISVDEGTREGVRYGLGFEHTWNGNAALQLLFEAEDYGEIENRSASLLIRRQF